MKLHEWQQQMRAIRKSPWLAKIEMLEHTKANLQRLNQDVSKIDAQILQLRYNMTHPGGQR